MTTIVGVRATQVNIPLEAPFRWSPGVFPGFSRTVVEIEADDGTVGIGEAPSPGAAEIISTVIRPKLVGADPQNFADCERRCLPPIEVAANTEDGAVLHAYGGVELALWDLVGKASGRSVADLLGGAVRDQAPFSEYFSLRVATENHPGEATAIDVARYCARMQEEHGSTVFEGKVGAAGTRADLVMVKEIRAAIGSEATLRLDANRAWSLTEAREMMRRLEALDVRSIEEPTTSALALARLRETTSIGFSTHDANLPQAVALGVPDAFVINLSALGGIRRSLRFIAACEQLGIDVWFYSPDTGIAQAAYLQVVAAVPWLSQPSQTLIRWHVDDVVAGGPRRPRDGCIPIPDGPGFGVALDLEALARCHRRFREDGPYDPYGTM